MDPDSFQKAWQAHASQTRVTVDANLLLKAVQREQQDFRATIFWRDAREIGVALLMVPLWFYLGFETSVPWTWYLTVPALIWVAGFMLVYRLRHNQKPSPQDEPLLSCIERSLSEVENQIWLLRNIFWWYLLPPSISLLAYFAHAIWQRSRDWLDVLGHSGVFINFILVYAFVYWVNQYGVRKNLVPRRQELLALRASLRDEITGEVEGEYPIMMREHNTCSHGRPTIVGVCILVLLIMGLVITAWRVARRGHPERSPFAAVRWQEFQPEVQVSGEWFKLVSLDEIPASEIIAFSRRTNGKLWRKRFEEDLVELLTHMGHPPEDKVTLLVQSPTSLERWTFKDVPMTKANRRAIRNAAQNRERQQP